MTEFTELFVHSVLIDQKLYLSKHFFFQIYPMEYFSRYTLLFLATRRSSIKPSVKYNTHRTSWNYIRIIIPRTVVRTARRHTRSTRYRLHRLILTLNKEPLRNLFQTIIICIFVYPTSLRRKKLIS